MSYNVFFLIQLPIRRCHLDERFGFMSAVINGCGLRFGYIASKHVIIQRNA